ncbi:hypothetical protein GEV33_015525 [Tenebrio molitor]|uniref:Odorant receptor n=2 Tax=Tenebrio molitor TaxID=7067 RepID=A0A8J6H3D9_TENMO|nr:hypothetical protein GEV33_015525 [Tenebrio molitor]
MERFNWQEIIATNIQILRIVGLWPIDSYQLDFYTLYSSISANLFVTAVLFQTINVIFVYSNLEALTETILICVAELLALFKIYTFIKNIKMLKRLMVVLDSDIFQPKSLDQRVLVRPAMLLWKMIYNILLGAVTAAVSLWLVFPILNGSTRRYALPFPAWYPYDIRKSPYYELTYLHQSVGTSLVALGDYNIDMLISAMMMYVGAQCDILCDNLRHLGGDSSDFASLLTHCVKHHTKILKCKTPNFTASFDSRQKICRFAEECNDFFNFILLGQFFTSSVCMAMGLFRLALVTPSSFEFYTLSFSILSVIMQIFTYCWFGEEVESKSSKIAYATFESEWIVQPSHVKKNMLIFVESAQHPVKLSTFKLFYLSLDTKKGPTIVIKRLYCFMTIAEFTARQVREVIDECGFVQMGHPPYSPDLAPSDYYLFSKLKKALERTPFFF